MIALLATALVPVFAGLIIGYIAGARKVVDNHNVKSLITFLMTFALPCSLFLVIVHTAHAELLGQGHIAAVIGIVYLIVYATTWFCARIIDKHSIGDAAVLSLTLSFPNVTAVGLPLLQSLYGPHGLVACSTGIAIGVMTVGPLTLALLESTTHAGHSLTLTQRISHAAWRAVKRPVVWAPLLGGLAVLAGVTLPPYIDRTLTILGAATAGVALFITGLIVSAQRFTLNLRVVVAVLLKNIGQPVLCLGIVLLLHLPVDAIRYTVLMSAIPCGFFGLVFGKGFNATPLTASSSLIASYVVGIFTLGGWIIFLGHLK